MRVATRRLRAALEIFEPCFPAEALRPGAHRGEAARRRPRRAPRPRRRDRRPARLQRPDGGARPPGRRLADRAVPRPSRRRRTRAWRRWSPRSRLKALRESLDELVQRRAGGGRVKARPVKKLDPSRALGENAARIVQVRLDEMLAFAPRALDGKTKAQHDMRIAAKRLRYVLEVTGFCFGRPADTARRRARDLQDILGEIHDCDVMLPRVREHLEELQRSDAQAVREKAGQAPDLDPRLAAQAPHRTAYRGPRRAGGLPGGPPRAAHRPLRRLLDAARRRRAPGCGSSARSTATCAARARPVAPRRPPRGARQQAEAADRAARRRRPRPSRRDSIASARPRRPSSARSATSRSSAGPLRRRAAPASSPRAALLPLLLLALLVLLRRGGVLLVLLLALLGGVARFGKPGRSSRNGNRRSCRSGTAPMASSGNSLGRGRGHLPVRRRDSRSIRAAR